MDVFSLPFIVRKNSHKMNIETILIQAISIQLHMSYLEKIYLYQMEKSADVRGKAASHLAFWEYY
jgi:hypothetical protein